jgi:hypothetical protein
VRNRDPTSKLAKAQIAGLPVKTTLGGVPLISRSRMRRRREPGCFSQHIAAAAIPGSRAPLVDVLILALAEWRDHTFIFDDVRRNTIAAPMLCRGITNKETIQRNLEMTTTSRDGVTGPLRGAIPHQLPQSN